VAKVKVIDRHTALDYAQVLKDLSDAYYPHVSKIVIVQDNLNIHKPASLYEAFHAEEARRLVGAVQVARHAQTRQLARYGLIRTQHPDVAVSRSANPR
jgi:hypothetical protein